MQGIPASVTAPLIMSLADLLSLANTLQDVAVSVAKRIFMVQIEEADGGVCPCCDRFGKVYKRKHDRVMAEGLLWLYELSRKHGMEKFHNKGNKSPRHVVRNGGSLAFNRHWGMVQQKPNPKDPSKRTSGQWRITTKGVWFVEGRLTIPKYCTIYNKVPWRFSEEKTDISGSLGRPFHYRELMDEDGKDD